MELPGGLKPLYKKNGFLAFESALEIFPAGHSRKSYSLGEWNSEMSWVSFYQELRPEGVFFAQNLFGDQFLFKDAVYLFDVETGGVDHFAQTLESWAERILEDYEVLTAQPIAHEWQAMNGRIPFRSRLVPITPFVFGGAFEPENLMAMDALASMRLRASLALQIKNLPDGASVTYEVV